jgi:hypothetical protein
MVILESHKLKFWDTHDEEELDDGGETLESRGDTPGPVAVDAEGTEGGPGSNDGAREPEGIEEGGKRATVSWVGDFRDQEWGGHLGKGGTETDAETGADEHAEVLSSGLEDSSDQDDERTDDDTPFATETVSDVGSHWDGAESTNGLDGVEETQVLWCWVSEVLLRSDARKQVVSNWMREGLPGGGWLSRKGRGTLVVRGLALKAYLLPAFNRLETVHHGTIEAVGVRGDERDDEQQVELDNVAVLPPFACGG